MSRRPRPAPHPLVALVATVLGALVVGLLGPVGPATAAGDVVVVDRPVPTRTRPISGELVTFRGAVPPRASRDVRLQQRQGDRWVRVASGRTGAQGRYALTTRVITLRGSSTVKYRVVAPRARVAGKVRATAVTRTRTLAPQGQTAGLRVDPSASTGPVDVTMTATFTPARRGRRVVFQERRQGDWETLAVTAQGRSGRAVLVRRFADVRTHEVRAVTSRASGAPRLATPVQTVTVRAG